MKGVDAETRAFYDGKKTRPVLGDPSFLDGLTGGPGPGNRSSRPEDRGTGRLREPPGMDRIIEATAEAFGIDKGDMYVSRRGRGGGNLPRLAAMSLCRTLGGHPIEKIVRKFGLRHYSSASVASSRLKRRMADNRKLAATVATIKKQLKSGT
jgi:hypothetical protein